MKETILYAILTLLVAVPIEKWRIDRIKNIKPNVDHNVSWLIGFGLYIILVVFFRILGWETAVFAVVCLGVRGMFYDPALNIANKKGLTYQSPKSDNNSDSWEVKILGEKFWVHRFFYLIIFAISFIIYYFNPFNW
jgi:hypothetical protein